MKKTLVASLLAIASLTMLTACDSSDISKAQTIASNLAKDPSSVQYKDMRVVVPGVLVCGSYNAKNGYGAYNGFTKMAVDIADGSFDSTNARYVAAVCTATSKADYDDIVSNQLIFKAVHAKLLDSAIEMLNEGKKYAGVLFGSDVVMAAIAASTKFRTAAEGLSKCFTGRNAQKCSDDAVASLK